MESWTEKHRPRTLDDIVGNRAALQELRAWADAWARGEVPKERAVILAGEPGVGKTTAAHALARDMGWGVVELNASDTRNYDAVRRIATQGAMHATLVGAVETGEAGYGGRQLVILDEADNLFGNEDRGGMRAITETVQNAANPVILIVNDYYELSRRGGALTRLAKTIKFTRVHKASIPKALRNIAVAEGVQVEPDALKLLADRSNGDLRGAVNDLQALSVGRDHITFDDVDALGSRDSLTDVWGLLGKVFYGSDADAARKAAWDVEETPENLILWIDENVPHLYTDRMDRLAAYRTLSKADVYLGRVRRRQHYRLWSYAGEMMTAGVCAAKFQKPNRARFQFPTWLRRMSSSRGARNLRDSTAAKIGAVTHTSRHIAREAHFPLVKALMQDDDDFAVKFAVEADLTAEEVAFLLDVKPTLKRVKTIMQRVDEARDAWKGEAKDRAAARATARRAEEEEDAPAVVTLEEAATPVDEGGTASDAADEADEAAPEEEEPKNQRSLFDF